MRKDFSEKLSVTETNSLAPDKKTIAAIKNELLSEEEVQHTTHNHNPAFIIIYKYIIIKAENNTLIQFNITKQLAPRQAVFVFLSSLS